MTTPSAPPSNAAKKFGVDLKTKNPHLSFLFYGETKSGKTRFMATFPKPLIIADKSERGYETIRSMAQYTPELFYDPSVEPEVWAVETGAEMMEALSTAEAELKRDPTKWRTVGIDSLTFYCDSWLSMRAAEMGAKLDMRRAYGDLAMHAAYIMKRYGEMQAHLIYTALARPPAEGQKGGPLLAGRTGEIAPARCHYVWHFEATSRMVGGEAEINYAIHTTPHGQWQAGGRDSGRLPAVLPEGNFRCVEEALDLQPFKTGPVVVGQRKFVPPPTGLKK